MLTPRDGEGEEDDGGESECSPGSSAASLASAATAPPTPKAPPVPSLEDIDRLEREPEPDMDGESIQLMVQELKQDKVRIILERALLDPFAKNKRAKMLKAFLRWSKLHPMHLKCDELAKQLQDRLTAFVSLRESYYRDVVSVKLHLTKIQDYKLQEEQKAAKQLQGDLYSVHALPSVNFQSLINRVSVRDESSIAMRENLVQAGLINVTTGKAYNAWERSKTFVKVMKQKKGAHFRLPSTEGESLGAAVPSTHDLFVKHCKQCVGIMQFTRGWNDEVEDAMRLKSVTNNMEKEILDLKFTILQINKIAFDQEAKIAQLTESNKRLTDAGVWMKSWTYQKEAEVREVDLQIQIRQEQIRQGMIYADLESTVVSLQERKEADKGKALLREAKLNQRLNREVELKEQERHLRMNMSESLSISEAAAAEKDEIIAALRAETAGQKETIAASKLSIESLTKKLEERDVALDEVKEKFIRLEMTSKETIEQVSYEKELVQTEFNEKAELVENLQTQIRGDKAVIRGLQARCEAIDVKEAQDKAREAYLASRPKRSLRVIAIVVRTAVRLSRAIAAGPPYYAAGALGRRETVKRIHQSYLPALEELSVCRERIPVLEAELAESKKEIGNLTYKGNEIRTALASTRDANKQLQGRVDELLKDIRAHANEFNSRIADLKASESALLDKIPQLKKISQRHRISAHLQRSLTRYLSRSLTQLHAVIKSMHPETLPTLPFSVLEQDRVAAGIEADPLQEAQAQALLLAMTTAPPDGHEATPAEENVLSEEEALRVKEEAKETARKERQQQLKSKFKAAFISLVKWLQKAKKERPFEGPTFAMPHADAETGAALLPLLGKDFDRLFLATSQKMTVAFQEERKKISRQVEFALIDAQHSSTFASTARSVIARTSHVIENELRVELRECYAVINEWEQREEKRLRKEAKQKRKAEEKLAKKAEKVELMQARRASKASGGAVSLPVQATTKTSTKASTKASTKSSTKVTKGAAAAAAAAADEEESITSGDTGHASGHSSTPSQSKSVPSSQAKSAALVTSGKNPGYLSMNYHSQSAGGGGGGGTLSSKAKTEFDMSVLDKPSLVAAYKKKMDSDSDDEDEKDDEEEVDDEESDGIPNAEDEIIDQLEEELQELQLEKNTLLEQIEEGQAREEQLHGDVRRLEGDVAVLTSDLKISRFDFEAAKDRIRLLRDAIEDNYRQRNVEIEGIKKEAQERAKLEEKKRKSAKRHRGTQIACSVCAIRSTEAAYGDDNFGEHASLCSGVSLMGNMNDALRGEFVLVARARTINGVKFHKPQPSTTHFSDAASGPENETEESKSLVDPVMAAHVAQAQELAQHFSQSKDKATLSNYYQKKAQKAAGAHHRPVSSNQRSSMTHARSDHHLVYGRPSSPASEDSPPTSSYSKRPSTANAKLYEYSRGTGEVGGIDESLVGSMQHAKLLSSASGIIAVPSLMGPPPSATQGIKSFHEIRKIESNTSAFLQQQLTESLQLVDSNNRPRSSIPSARAPAPPLDGVVHKRQLSAVPVRSQSATELISHLRRTVAPPESGNTNSSANAGKVSLVAMDKKHKEALLAQQWKLTDGNFELPLGRGLHDAIEVTMNNKRAQSPVPPHREEDLDLQEEPSITSTIL